MVNRLTSVSPFLPHEGIDHAGGEYLLRQLMEFNVAGWQVSIICPRTPENVKRISSAPKWLHVHLCPSEPELKRPRRYWRLFRTGLVSTPSKNWVAGLDRNAYAALTSATAIDLQWSQSIFLARAIRHMVPRTPIFGTAHDILTQSAERARSSKDLRTRFISTLTYGAIRRNEVAGMNSCDSIFVFNPDDASRIQEMGVGTVVRTTPPYIALPKGEIAPDPKSKLLVFTAAFWRSENAESAAWFMNQVWPRIKSRCPDARVRFAGSRPPEWLIALSSESVEVTGYIPDLCESYRGAALAVIPLVRGAGLKFKVIQAIALGYPVVGTSIAVEGVSTLIGSNLQSVCDDPLEFAQAVIDTLNNLPASIDDASLLKLATTENLDFSRNMQVQIRHYQQSHINS